MPGQHSRRWPRFKPQLVRRLVVLQKTIHDSLCLLVATEESIHTMLCQCWASVEDGGPTLKQHWGNASCFWGSSVPRHKALEDKIFTRY